MTAVHNLVVDMPWKWLRRLQLEAFQMEITPSQVCCFTWSQ